jgi:Nickel responsive protein SCO4226-like
MPNYLVERYLPGCDRAWLLSALARIPRGRREVRYLGSTYLPSDESCLCRFEAETAEDVRDANEVAGVPFARIVPAEEIGVTQRGHTREGSM